MADCYRCVVVLSRQGEGVGVCQACGAIACPGDGERDLSAADFVCGMCDTTRLTSSAGVGPSGPSGGGSGGVGPGGSPPPSSGGGGGAAAAVYASSRDFEERRPGVAEASRGHRAVFHERIDHILRDLREYATSDTAAALMSVEAEELDEGRVRDTARRFVAQIDAADAEGRFDRELLADAFGVAAWSIGAGPAEEPTVGQLSHLADARLRLAIGRFTPVGV
jgi:hypothetical protein